MTSDHLLSLLARFFEYNVSIYCHWKDSLYASPTHS